MTQRWIEVNDLSSGQNSVNKNMRLEISLLRSGLCDDRDAYIVVKGTIDLLQMKMIKLMKMWRLKIMLCLDHAFQKLTVHR